MFTHLIAWIFRRKIIWLKLFDGTIEYTLENRVRNPFLPRTCYRFWFTRIGLVTMLPDGSCKMGQINYIIEWKEERQ
jgi:hypothetical protein